MHPTAYIGLKEAPKIKTVSMNRASCDQVPSQVRAACIWSLLWILLWAVL
jgi:hypothetical protein